MWCCNAGFFVEGLVLNGPRWFVAMQVSWSKQTRMHLTTAFSAIASFVANTIHIMLLIIKIQEAASPNIHGEDRAST